MQIQPFFARFLETQRAAVDPSSEVSATETDKAGALAKPNTKMVTMMYPSDSDAQEAPRTGHRQVRFHRPSTPPLTPAPSNPGSGDIHTLAFPSDSDTIDGRMLY